MKGSQGSLNTIYIQDFKLIEDQELPSANRNDNPQYSHFVDNNSYPPTLNSIHFSTYQANNSRIFTILISLLLMMLVVSFAFYFKEVISLLVQQLQIVEIQQHGKNSKFTEDKNLYKILEFEATHLSNFDEHLKSICPDIKQTFHIHLNTSYQQQSLPINIRNQIDLCGTTVLTEMDLFELKEKWNRKFPEMNILDQNLLSTEIKQNLLAFLTLYFFGGTYININVPYSNLHYRCQKYVRTGFEILFGDFQQRNQQNIYVPNPNKFVKARFPYSPYLKKMIEKIIKNQDFLDECRKKQCLVMKCI